MHYSFTAYGHPNITGTHKATLEFTKDKEITKNASCITGVNSDFDPEKLGDIAKNSKKVRITISVDGLSEYIDAEANPGFGDKSEIVIRKGDFVSKRTLAVKADKAACGLSRKIIEKIRDPGCKIVVRIEQPIQPL